ncbi:GNAT family N-acetyltransferase [Maribacter sp. 2307ULW6-5]|uniref:GNAT family N-acetyltransferase n=1 Tax=Maribacter sp. 2307ULW6-5 TaxID=3386275 RepID=UPI0039BC5AE4
METALIRPISPKDNVAVAQLIRTVLLDFGVPKVGSAYADVSLDSLYQHYQLPRSAFYVVELQGTLAGCAGLGPLEGYPGNCCELQKMYFSESARGLGLGAKMIDRCLAKARKFGFQQCYLETMPNMESAQKLYLRFGFDYIDGPLGNTGHHACTVHMLKTL